MTAFLTYPGSDLTVESFGVARRDLTLFMSDLGEELAEEYRFGWDDTKKVPATPSALRAAFDHSEQTRAALPVPSMEQGSTIYTDQDAQGAASFWHYLSHIEYGYGYEASDELEIAYRQLAVVKECRLSPLAVAVLEADLLGAVFLHTGGDEPAANRVRFVSDVLMFGLVDGIALERQRQQLAAA